MKIIISPYAQKLRNGQNNAKNYPYWQELINLLKYNNNYIIQIGVLGEKKLDNIDEFLLDKSVKELKQLLFNCDFWISVDNFFNHFATFFEKKGVVIWGKSDPNVFGYEQNINILKSRTNLRQRQFAIWEEEKFDENVFEQADIIFNIIKNNFKF